MPSSSVSFSDILIHLGDQTQPFPAKYLQYFTDLGPDQEVMLSDLWKDLATTKKVPFLEDLNDLAEQDTLMDFTAVGNIALNDQDEQVREAALNLFWECESKRFIPTGLRLLEDDPSARVRALSAAIMGHFIFLGETDAIPEESANVIVECLLNTYKNDSDKLVRRRALESLGYSSRSEINPLITQAIAQQDDEWLASGLYAMGRSADPSWSKLISNYLHHPDSSVREEAVRAAGELELINIRKILLDILDEDEDEDVRAAAIWSLSQIGGEDVRETFTKLLEEAEDDEFSDFLENALDNLSFTEELAQFNHFEIDSDENDA